MPAQNKHSGRQIVVAHSRFVRITHWLNALAILVMIGSGWRIYNNVPIIHGLTFPEWATLGGDPEITYKLNKDVGFSNALLWHFAFMWLFFVNGAVALAGGLLSGRFRRKWLPVTLHELIHDLRAALTFNLAHDDITVYNAVQKLLYIGVACAMLLMLASGLAIWKPVQFGWLTWLFYDFQGARLVHFLGMSAIVLFLLVHVTLAILVPQTIVAMTKGSIRAAAPAEEPAEALVPAPVEATADVRVERPSRAPAETLAEALAEAPANGPEETPVHEPAEAPAGHAPIEARKPIDAGEKR